MRLSRFFLPTMKDTPREAEIVSHRLMLRAGMMQQASAGIYSWLPLGHRVLKKIEQIVREEHVSDEAALFKRYFDEIPLRNRVRFGMSSREVVSLFGLEETDLYGYAKDYRATPTEKQLELDPVYHLNAFSDRGRRLNLDFNRQKMLVGINQYITLEK